jgi:hypothetical protein
MLDESTDVSVSQNVVVYVRYLASVGGRVTPVTRFLGIKGFLKPCVNTKSTKPTWPWFPAGSGVSVRHTMTAE